MVTQSAPLVIEESRAHLRVWDNGAVRDLGVVADAGSPSPLFRRSVARIRRSTGRMAEGWPA